MVSPAQSSLTQLAPAAISSQISYTVAAKSLDAQKQEGAAVLQLLDAATIAPPPAANDLGGTLDLTA